MKVVDILLWTMLVLDLIGLMIIFGTSGSIVAIWCAVIAGCIWIIVGYLVRTNSVISETKQNIFRFLFGTSIFVLAMQSSSIKSELPWWLIPSAFLGTWVVCRVWQYIVSQRYRK